MHLVLVALHIEPSARAVPLGPAMLASALRLHHPHQVRTTLVDQFLDASPEACADALLAHGPDAVGFSVYVWNRARVLEIAEILRQRQPNLLLLAGGAEASADPEGLRASGPLDLVLPGEGEDLLVRVMGRLLQGHSPQELQRDLEPAPVQDLGTLPSPILDGTLDPGQYPGMLWELSRGCPFRCDFCFESRGLPGTRRVPMARIEAELACFEAREVSQVFVLDPTFNHDKVQAKDILRLIARVAPRIHFFFEVRSEFIDAELARLFASLRCTLQIGLQSVHDTVLRNLNRRIRPGDFQAKILHLHRAGAVYGFDLIYGLPGDTLEGFLESLDFALGLAPNHLDLFPLSVLPGTRLRDTAPGFGLEYLPQAPYTVQSSPTFSATDMQEAARLARATDRLYNEGKAVPWFGLLREAVDLPPSALIRRFADHLETPQGDSPLPMELATFMAAQFEDPGQAAIAFTLVSWSTHVGEMTEASARATPPSPPTKDRPRLAPHTRYLHFPRDPEALLEQLNLGITELEDLAFVLPDTPCHLLLSLQTGDPVVERLTAPEAETLRRLLEGRGDDGSDALAERLHGAGLLVLANPTHQGADAVR